MDIIVDVDCTVADFVGGILRVAGETDRTAAKEFDWFTTAYGPEKAELIREALDDSTAFWQNLPMIPNAMDGIKWLREQGHKIMWVTSPYEGKYGWESDRRVWLNEHLAIGLFNEPLLFVENKQVIEARAIIDDLRETVVNWEARHRSGLGIVFGSEMNRQLGHYLIGWKDIMNMRFFEQGKIHQ